MNTPSNVNFRTKSTLKRRQVVLESLSLSDGMAVGPGANRLLIHAGH